MENQMKSFKFQFDVIVEKVDLTVSFGCQISVIWKRGSNKIETKGKPTLDLNSHQAIFNEKLTMFSNMYFYEKVKTFHEKKTSFTVVLATSKGNKIAGVCTLDLGSLLNNKIVELTENYRLEKCPDKNAKIFLKIKTSFLGEVKDVDAVSQFTDISKMNDSFEALTSQNLEGLKESLLIDKKKNIEELTINKNSINLDNSSVSFNGKERDKLIETVKNLEEKSKLLQNENNELLKNFNKIKIKEKEDYNELLKRFQLIEQEKKNLSNNLVILQKKYDDFSKNQFTENDEKSGNYEMMSKLKEKFEIEKQELNAEKEKIQIFLKDSNKKYENQLKEMKMKNGELSESIAKYEINFEKNIEGMKKLETENKEMKEKLKELNLDKNSRSNNTNEIEGINKLEEKIKQLEAKLSDSQNLNAGFEKKISIYSKEMESRFKKLIQESEKKEIENKDLIKKNESLLNKLQENDKNLSNSSSANVKCDILNQENSELKKQNQALVEALENLEGKIINLQKKFQVGNNKKENHEDIEAYNALKEKFANLELQKNKLESECSQAKMNWVKTNNEVGLLREEALQSKKKLAKMNELEEQFNLNQEELRKNKQRIGDAINIAFEVGGSDLVDRLINVMKF